MKVFAFILISSFLLLTFQTQAHEADEHMPQEVSEVPQGYVLKPEEGEVLFDDFSTIIKASPKTGTQGMVFIQGKDTPGGTSGVHVHLIADELFYIIGGVGWILIGTEEYEISTGDVIFVPAGTDHKVSSSIDDPLEMIFIVDRPGLEEQFRLEAQGLDRTKMTLEEFNEVARKYGTVYKSFD